VINFFACPAADKWSGVADKLQYLKRD